MSYGNQIVTEKWFEKEDLAVEENYVSEVVDALIRTFTRSYRKFPIKLFINEEEEAQSIYMLCANAYDLDFELTENDTHVE